MAFQFFLDRKFEIGGHILNNCRLIISSKNKMGADWYSCLSFFGYEIKVPEDTTYRKFVNKLFGIESILEKPFSIMGLLSEFHSRMEGMTSYELSEMDENAYLILGFFPTNDFTEMAELAKKLAEYITDNPILTGLTFDEKPKLYSGIDWYSNVEVEEESDDEDDDDDEDDEDDDDDNNQTETESEDSSDEDEHKIAPEPKTK